ncbi:hypothetical protein ACFWGI_38685 [Streptomyces niveus]|uniref:hypothetical protein n=1 Tax=Streptomyces niveus TaxID=193462 RepID=UPI003659F112
MLGVISWSDLSDTGEWMIKKNVLRAGICVAASCVILLATSVAASADRWNWGGVSDMQSDPRDPGNGTREGKDLEVYFNIDGASLAKIRFHAWDEKLDRLNLTGTTDMFARITYYPRGSDKKIEWNVDVPPGVDSSVQLGSDDDLNEGGDIYIKMCFDGTNDCSGSFHGIT